MNLTKNKITINSIIEFVHNAMHYNMHVSKDFYHFEDSQEWYFYVDNDKNYIRYIIKKTIKGDSIIIESHTGTLVLNTTLSDRDVLDLNALNLDIKEYGEDKALSEFNNFFSNIEEKPTNIDDLDED